jgi:ABC-type nitrate/sulfonate/bicarbonate transport system permease component
MAYTRFLPPLAVVAALIAAWWVAVVQTGSAIFPTPLKVLAGARELAEGAHHLQRTGHQARAGQRHGGAPGEHEGGHTGGRQEAITDRHEGG